MRAAVLLLALPACFASDDDGGDDDFEPSDMELALHDRVNDHRASIGLDPLELDLGFGGVARGHSADMADGSVAFGHDGFDARADELGDQQPTLMGVGENVAYVSDGWEDPAGTIVQGWLDSEGHRANIEDPAWTHAGMGAVQDADAGWYATQLFGTY
jgi:uncharacterized protein YkwD